LIPKGQSRKLNALEGKGQHVRPPKGKAGGEGRITRHVNPFKRKRGEKSFQLSGGEAHQNKAHFSEGVEKGGRNFFEFLSRPRGRKSKPQGTKGGKGGRIHPEKSLFQEKRKNLSPDIEGFARRKQ